MVPADIVLAVVNAARWIDADGELAPFARADVSFARNFRRILHRPFGSLGHLVHRYSADDPSVGIEPVVDVFIMPAQDIAGDTLGGRGEAARMQTAVDGCAH